MDSTKLQDTKSTFKNLLHFYTLNMNYLKEKLRIQSHLQYQKSIKYLGIYLTKVKNLYTANCKTLMKEDANRWKDIPCSWNEALILLKCPYYPKQSIVSVQSLIKIPMVFFSIEKINKNSYGTEKD